jgi:hypothetical protein
MINVNQITSQLAKMPDQALQQYAAMHKNDPYTVALALAESNRRKEMRTGAQMQQGPQPKVVDQEIEGMAAPQQVLPEDSGIAQLPAQNIQGMAGGGIVAFEEGGEVPRYNGAVDGSVVKRGWNQYAPSGYGNTLAAPPTAEEMADYNRASRMGFSGNVSDFLGKIRSSVAGMFPETKDTVTNLQTTTRKETPKQSIAATLDAEDARVAQPVSNAPTQTNAAPTADPRRTDNPASPYAVKDKTGVAQLAGAAGIAGAAGAGGGEKQPAPGSPLANAAAKAAAGIDSLLPAKEKIKDRKDFLAEREEISKPVYEKAEGMINKEKSRLNEGKEQDFYMALIEGGLAAAASDSPNGIQNLAKGFSQGAKSYSSALKDFRKAAQENSKMELDIERAKAAEKRGDMDAYQKYEDSAMNRHADIDKLRTSGAFQLANTNLAGQFQLQASANSAAAQIAAAKLPGAQERLFSTLGGGDVNKGLKIFQEAQTDKTGAAYAKLYSDYAANADKSGADKMSPVEFAQNMQQFMSAMQGGGFQPKPTNSTVRTLPSN